MRTGKCPKCGNHRIATTHFALYLGGGVTGPTIDLFACADCRYVEQYMRDSVDARVSVLDAWRWVKPEEGPFR